MDITNIDFGPVFEKSNWLLEGCLTTLSTAIMSIVLALVFGIIGAFFRMSSNKVLNRISFLYVWVIRGTPTLVQVFMLYYALPQFGILLPNTVAGVLALAFNAGAYITEIIRSSYQAINKGQMEAALSLGMKPYQAIFRIISPQAFKISLPPLVNQFSATVKNTSIVSYVAITELFRMGSNIIYLTFRTFETYVVLAALYLIMCSIIMFAANKLEERLLK